MTYHGFMTYHGISTFFRGFWDYALGIKGNETRISLGNIRLIINQVNVFDKNFVQYGENKALNLYNMTKMKMTDNVGAVDLGRYPLPKKVLIAIPKYPHSPKLANTTIQKRPNPFPFLQRQI